MITTDTLHNLDSRSVFVDRPIYVEGTSTSSTNAICCLLKTFSAAQKQTRLFKA